MKKFFFISALAFFGTATLIIFFWFSGYKQPQFFSLNDPDAEYKVDKNERGDYIIRYSGVSPFKINSVIVGKSPINLELYNGKSVILKGEFVQSDKQCIEGKCKSIYGPHVVLDVYSVKEN